jgi:hypothetical protein
MPDLHEIYLEEMGRQKPFNLRRQEDVPLPTARNIAIPEKDAIVRVHGTIFAFEYAEPPSS